MLEKLFGFDRKVTSVRTEVMAGITTFLTMAYILAINPNVLSATGMDKGALFTTTVVASAFATLLMAFYAKLPFSLAPGMGLSTFFAYTVCLTMGYTWQFALTAVLIEGIIFILLTVSNLREKIVNAIPETLKHAIGAGIGLFISFIGLQNARIIVNNDVTLLGLGDITSGPALLGIIGLVLTARDIAYHIDRYTDGNHPVRRGVQCSSFHRTHLLPVRMETDIHQRNAHRGVHLPLCGYVRYHRYTGRGDYQSRYGG